GIRGAATDGRRVYTNIANGDQQNFTLAPSIQTTIAGARAAFDTDSGKILWTAAIPSKEASQAPVAVTNGFVFAGSVASNGPAYAMDASTADVEYWCYNIRGCFGEIPVHIRPESVFSCPGQVSPFLDSWD
ncbi:hypothetical protein C1H46_027012, partial [Malus baccata]